MVVDERMNRLAEDCGAANAGEFAGGAKSASDFGRGDLDAQRAGGLDFGKFAKRVGRAVGDEFAVIDVGDVAAAFGFVHVVRGDEKSDAVSGKFEEQIPKLAASDRIDAGGRLIEEEE